MFTDTHAHLTDKRFNSPAEIIAESTNAGVDLIINAGYDLSSSIGGKKLAQSFNGVYFAAGIHPSEANENNDHALLECTKLLSNEKCVAVGEIGLDYHYDGFDKNRQISLFMQQAETAYSADLPLIIHSRDCTEDMLNLIKNNAKYFKKAVMHCFSGSKETAEILTRQGLFISFAGPVTFSNAKGLLGAASVVPDEFLLTETDCPYLSPEPFRGRLNKPSNVVYVARKLAEIRNCSLDSLAKTVRKNTLTLFNKIKGDFNI